MSDKYEKSVGLALVRAQRLHRARTAELLTEIGLYPGQEQMIIILKAGSCTIGELATSLQIRPATASKAVARLEADGWIVRLPPSADARLVRVALSERGIEKARAVEELYYALEMDALFGMSHKDKTILRTLLRRVTVSLRTAQAIKTK